MNPEPYRPEALVLSSGGTKGLAHLGALCKMLHWDEKVLDNTDHFVGASVGGVILALMNVGYHPYEICIIALETSLVKSWRELNKLDTALHEFGALDYSLAVAPMREMIMKKFSTMPTLAELHSKTGIRLTLVCGDLETRKQYDIDYISEPTLPLIDAITMTMLVPGMVSKYIHKGHLMIDGAFVNPFPINVADDGSRKVLAITVLSENNEQPSDPFSYLYATLTMSLDRLGEIAEERASKKVHIVRLRVPEITLLDRGSDINKRYLCFHKGMLEAENQLSTIMNRSLIPNSSWMCPPSFTPVCVFSLPVEKKQIFPFLRKRGNKIIDRVTDRLLNAGEKS
jgi:predicted acylesterase/phospholipase RssA